MEEAIRECVAWLRDSIPPGTIQLALIARSVRIADNQGREIVGVDLGAIIDDQTHTSDAAALQSALLSLLDSVQDAVVEELAAWWPARSPGDATAIPHADFEEVEQGSTLVLGFADRQGWVIRHSVSLSSWPDTGLASNSRDDED